MILVHQTFHYRGKSLIEKVVFQPPFRFAADFRDEACFIYFREGQIKINAPSGQLGVASGESVLLKCGSYFSDLMPLGDVKQYEILVFHLYPEILRDIYQDEVPPFLQPSRSKSFFRKVVSKEIITKFIESLHFYFENPGLLSDDILNLKIKELILLLIQSDSAESIKDLFSDLFTPRHLDFKEVVNNHLFSDISIADLALLCRVSASTFNRSFKTLYKTTPAQYLKSKRLEKAKELLSVSALTISEIAYRTRFSDTAHFSRSFKAAYRISPTAFRAGMLLEAESDFRVD